MRTAPWAWWWTFFIVSQRELATTLRRLGVDRNILQIMVKDTVEGRKGNLTKSKRIARGVQGPGSGAC